MSRIARLFIVSITIVGLFCTSAIADGAPQPLDAEDQPLVLMEFDRLYIDRPVAADLAVMSVRVFGPDNELLMSVRSTGDPVEFMIADSLPNGTYRYEVVSIFGPDDFSSRLRGSADAVHTVGRVYGSFRIWAGALEPELEESEALMDDASVFDALLDQAATLVGQALEFLASPAYAADLTTAPDGDVVIEDDTPAIKFRYSANPSTVDGIDTWWIRAYNNGTTAPDFDIYDQATNRRVLALESGTDTTNSMVVDSDGDIHWANGRMNFDRGASKLSIGTSAINNGADLNVSAFNPDVNLWATMFDDSMGFEYDGNWLNTYFYDDSPDTVLRNIVRINFQAPEDALVIDGLGQVGLGTYAERQLHLAGPNAVFRMDRTKDTAAFLLVRVNSGGSILKSFFMGTNASGPNQGEFVVSDQGTTTTGPGTRRMTIQNNGDVVFTGNVFAANIVPVSTIRFKEHVEPLAGALELAQQLQGVRFDWKDSGKPSIGLIAEDVEGVLPEVVARDSETGEVAGLNYDAIVPVLLEALKEQQANFEAQQAKYAAQQAKYEAQQQQIMDLQQQVAEYQSVQTRLAALEALATLQQAEAALVSN